jgi:hypothetical protein
MLGAAAAVPAVADPAGGGSAPEADADDAREVGVGARAVDGARGGSTGARRVAEA